MDGWIDDGWRESESVLEAHCSLGEQLVIDTEPLTATPEGSEMHTPTRVHGDG